MQSLLFDRQSLPIVRLSFTTPLLALWYTNSHSSEVGLTPAVSNAQR